MLGILTYVMYVVVIIVWLGVLIVGRVPAGLASFMVGIGRWNCRAYAYYALLTDDYPPFTLD